MKIVRYILLSLGCLCSVTANMDAVTNRHRAQKIEKVQADSILKKYANVINDLKKDNISIPADVFHKAKGVLILENYKAGLLIGGEGTDAAGCKIQHTEYGTQYGPLVFYSGPGISAGFQVGVSQNAIVMLLMTDDSLQALQGKGVQLSGGLRAAAGPKGVGASTIDNADVYVYSTSSGLELGASVALNNLEVNHEQMQQFYGNGICPDGKCTEQHIQSILDKTDPVVAKRQRIDAEKQLFSALRELVYTKEVQK